MTETDLHLISSQIRGRLVEMSHNSKTPHLGSCLSCTDLLTVLYWKILSIDPKHPYDENRDRLVLSKGHGAPALYATLAKKGFFPEALLDSYAHNGSTLAEHPGPFCQPGVEAATGSLGHGLSLGLGIALAGKKQDKKYRVFVLMSDGECNEGSVWEAAMLASSAKVGNLVAVIDYNKWQATGRSREVMALEPFQKKWEAFGWNALEIDGHDLVAIQSALENLPKNSDKPSVIIAHTIKGKGVSFMEDDNNWHYRIPNEEEVEKAHKELGLK